MVDIFSQKIQQYVLSLQCHRSTLGTAAGAYPGLAPQGAKNITHPCYALKLRLVNKNNVYNSLYCIRNLTDTNRKITEFALQHDCIEKTILTRNIEMQVC